MGIRSGRDIMSVIGKRFGRLVALRATSQRGGNQEIIYKCKCDCGNYKYTTSARLKNGSVKSCGCYNIDTSIEIGKKARKRNEKYYKDGTFILALDLKKPKENNTSGYTGVSWHKKYNKWYAHIALKGKRYYLGQFDNIEDAIKVRKAAEEILFKPVLEGKNITEWEPEKLRNEIYKRLKDPL